MTLWQADFYRRPLSGPEGQPLWELLICDCTLAFTFGATCTQSQANAAWLEAQLAIACKKAPQKPEAIAVFRPQCLSLLQTASQALGIPVKATRRTLALKRWLLQRSQWYPSLANYSGEAYEPLALDRPPPVPLSENLWGDRWRFAAIAAQDIESFSDEPIPVLEIPTDLQPLSLGLASTTLLPGIVIDGGRQSMPLALWLQSAPPVSLNYIAGSPDGLILEAGLVDRWIIETFEDNEVAIAARNFEQRKQQSQGLHFLLVQPDDTGVTYTGFWLLQDERFGQ
ncbi:Tab2/Atab2 family RNA-binding protein [Almyronema epifaneia]|uniref:Tab2/Atab2 family RNA-binding protein n=1 Tax=Almyronema epifaneia S1 TaxID=2991925 RepID=A0ABW6IAF2_9CYAN